MVEMLTDDEASDRLGRWVKRPTTWDSICVVRNDGIHIYPITIQLVDFYYYRYPLAPVFAYTANTGYITDDPGNSTQFEWPEHLHNDLVRLILGYVGINIRDEQLFQYAEQKKQAGV
jgi:hypothetical protein